jgi:hypothetical protein
VIDTDGDLISDFDEVNATPPTDPNDPSQYPTGSSTPLLAGLHAFPGLISGEQEVSIDESYAPFGHRPERDKVGDDGSSTIVDRNGVLIWTNDNGEALDIPDSSFAKTMHVSNTECLVYNNRLVDGWNSAAHQAEIIIYRRGLTGGIISKTPLTIDGTVLDTASITPTTYGFMLVSGKRSDDADYWQHQGAGWCVFPRGSTPRSRPVGPLGPYLEYHYLGWEAEHACGRQIFHP